MAGICSPNEPCCSLKGIIVTGGRIRNFLNAVDVEISHDNIRKSNNLQVFQWCEVHRGQSNPAEADLV